MKKTFELILFRGTDNQKWVWNIAFGWDQEAPLRPFPKIIYSNTPKNNPCFSIGVFGIWLNVGVLSNEE